MSNLRRKIFTTIVVLSCIFLIGCVIKVLIWEQFYYNNQEGQPRQAPTKVTPSADNEANVISDIQPTETEVTEYYVAPDMPRYLYIPSIGISKTRIKVVGRAESGRIDVPSNVFDAAWYNESKKPGTECQPTERLCASLIDAHSGVDGIFKDLAQLRAGDLIKIEMGDAQVYTYSVSEIQDMPLDDANAYMDKMLLTPQPGTPSLSIITCAGYWNQGIRSYTERTMIRALQIETE